MRVTFPLGRDRRQGPPPRDRLRATRAAGPDDGAGRGDRMRRAGRRPPGVLGAGQATTNAGVLAGFAQEA
ncbi:hypothetical protein [Microbispora catharanthi]|uniref:Uncharacterized protein n=1 Tax=Microbispora catharanthi TaxID=1712871 RepID=A0A5N6BTK6_9ACTN|nr:hypothetical protein [Microbispora catharanthi]KAB8183762.1 hypothetical protein FH610_019095 [Microbispora catharanthi]